MRKFAMPWSATLAVALCAAVVTSAARASERVGSEALASRIETGGFEFRGSGRTASGFENVIWRFQPDGRVVSEGAISRLFYLGGMGEQFGLKGSGNWRREGDKVCVTWDAYNRRFDGCYGMLLLHGSVVHLTGPQFMAGGLERAERAPSTAAADESPICALTFRRALSARGPVARSCGSRTH